MVTLIDVVKEDTKQFYTHLSESAPYIIHGLYTPFLMKRGLTKLTELDSNNASSYQGLGYLVGIAIAGTTLIGATMKYGPIVPLIAIATNTADYLLTAQRRVQKKNEELSSYLMPEEFELFEQN